MKHLADPMLDLAGARRRSLLWATGGAVVALTLGSIGCGQAIAPEFAGGSDGAVDGSADAAVVEGGTADAGLDPSVVGTLPTSCGQPSAGVPTVDCTADGDRDAICVFGHHCACSAGFRCTVPYDPNQRCTGAFPCDCAPGARCVPR
jgi:hypothetical protein